MSHWHFFGTFLPFYNFLHTMCGFYFQKRKTKRITMTEVFKVLRGQRARGSSPRPQVTTSGYAVWCSYWDSFEYHAAVICLSKGFYFLAQFPHSSLDRKKMALLSQAQLCSGSQGHVSSQPDLSSCLAGQIWWQVCYVASFQGSEARRLACPSLQCSDEVPEAFLTPHRAPSPQIWQLKELGGGGKGGELGCFSWGIGASRGGGWLVACSRQPSK